MIVSAGGRIPHPQTRAGYADELRSDPAALRAHATGSMRPAPSQVPRRTALPRGMASWSLPKIRQTPSKRSPLRHCAAITLRDAAVKRRWFMGSGASQIGAATDV
jgi:hypothetical protein